MTSDNKQMAPRKCSGGSCPIRKPKAAKKSKAAKKPKASKASKKFVVSKALHRASKDKAYRDSAEFRAKLRPLVDKYMKLDRKSAERLSKADMVKLARDLRLFWDIVTTKSTDLVPTEKWSKDRLLEVIRRDTDDEMHRMMQDYVVDLKL